MGHRVIRDPGPLSRISTTTPSPLVSARASIRRLPDPPIASIALSTRLVQTWLSSLP
jgi:hypothetical protein